MRRASFLRSFALRCSLTPMATPVTVGMAAIVRRPMTMMSFVVGQILEDVDVAK